MANQGSDQKSREISSSLLYSMIADLGISDTQIAAELNISDDYLKELKEGIIVSRDSDIGKKLLKLENELFLKSKNLQSAPKLQKAKEYYEAHPNASYREIGKAVGVGKDTVARWIKSNFAPKVSSRRQQSGESINLDAEFDRILERVKFFCHGEFEPEESNNGYSFGLSDGDEYFAVYCDDIYIDTYGCFSAWIRIKEIEGDTTFCMERVNISNDSHVREYINKPLAVSLKENGYNEEHIAKIIKFINTVLHALAMALHTHIQVEPSVIQGFVKARQQYHVKTSGYYRRKPRKNE